MRYRSPARSSFRDNKTYETLTTRSTYSTVTGGGVDHSNYHSDDSIDHGSTEGGDKHHQQQQQQQHKKNKTYMFNGDMPPQTDISAPVSITGDVPWMNSANQARNPGNPGHNPGGNNPGHPAAGDYQYAGDLGSGDQPQNQFTFSIMGNSPSATVI